MEDSTAILQLIKKTVSASDPTATLILYGSYARGEQRADSDIDILVLVDSDTLTHKEEDHITYPLYQIEFKTGTLINPLVYSRKKWADHKITQFYENVQKEGRVL